MVHSWHINKQKPTAGLTRSFIVVRRFSHFSLGWPGLNSEASFWLSAGIVTYSWRTTWWTFTAVIASSYRTKHVPFFVWMKGLSKDNNETFSAACKIVLSYFIKLGAVWKILLATCSNGKHNIQYQNKLIALAIMQYPSMFNFQRSRQQTSQRKLVSSLQVTHLPPVWDLLLPLA